jgi:hypothetical protein
MTTYSDPRGPIRTIKRVEEDPNGGLTRLHLDCGHISLANQIYHYETGARSRCIECCEKEQVNSGAGS